MRNDQMSLETFQVPLKRLGSSVDKCIVVKKNIQIDCTWTVANRGHASHGAFYFFKNRQQCKGSNGSFNLNTRR